MRARESGAMPPDLAIEGILQTMESPVRGSAVPRQYCGLPIIDPESGEEVSRTAASVSAAESLSAESIIAGCRSAASMLVGGIDGRASVQKEETADEDRRICLLR